MLDFRNTQFNAPVRIDSVSTENQGVGSAGGALRFHTTPNGTTTLTERVRIDNNGNVGIGTTSPGAALDVNGSIRSLNSGANDAQLMLNQSGTGGRLYQLLSTGSADSTGAGNFGLYDGTAGAWRMFVNSSGNVGIGTTSPGQKIDAYIGGGSAGLPATSGSSQTGIGRFESGAGNSVDIGVNGASPYQGWIQATNPSALGTNYSLLLNPNGGNVGIGTTSPGSKLQVSGGSALMSGSHDTIAAPNSWTNSNGTSGEIAIAYDATNSNGRISSVHEGTSWSPLYFQAKEFDFTTGIFGLNAVPAMMINSSGNVGIGTTSPGQKLQVGTNGDGSVAIANAWNTFSDRRLKNIIGRIPNACAMVDQLNGYYYTWKTASDQSRQVGVIAQEVEAVLPELVKTGSDGIKSVDYPKLTAVLIEANKELYSKLLGTDARVTAIEADSAAKTRDIASVKAEAAQLKANDAAKDRDIASMKQENAELKARMDRLEKALQGK